VQKEYRNLVSRKDFYKVHPGPAPWDSEPDVIVGTYRGFAYAILRNPWIGALTGYVAMPQKHPWYNMDYEDIPAYIESDEGSWRVHGGLTYARGCLGYDGLCTITVPGNPVWWVGFDTAHSGDFQPTGVLNVGNARVGAYRTVGYVFEQILNLTRKASERGEGPDIFPDVHLG